MARSAEAGDRQHRRSVCARLAGEIAGAMATPVFVGRLESPTSRGRRSEFGALLLGDERAVEGDANDSSPKP